MDDLTGAACEEHAFEVYQSTKQVMKCDGFNVWKWKYYSKGLSDRFGGCEATKPTRKPNKTRFTASVVEHGRTKVESVVGRQAVDENKTRILEISWDTKEYELF